MRELIGVLLVIFAIIDFVTANVFGIDITGVHWSSLVASLVGTFLISLGD